MLGRALKKKINSNKKISYHNRTHLLLFYLCVISVMLCGRRVDRRPALADHISVSLFSLRSTPPPAMSAHRFSMLIIYLLLLLLVARERGKFYTNASSYPSMMCNWPIQSDAIEKIVAKHENVHGAQSRRNILILGNFLIDVSKCK